VLPELLHVRPKLLTERPVAVATISELPREQYVWQYPSPHSPNAQPVRPQLLAAVAAVALPNGPDLALSVHGLQRGPNSPL